MRGLRAILASTTSVLTLTGLTYPVQAEPAAAELPTPAQALEVFRDRWGPSDFALKGTSSWVPHSMWHRVAPQYIFNPGTNEFTTEPIINREPKPFDSTLFQRTVHGRPEYQTIQTAHEPDGTATNNYFPVFRGTPKEYTVYGSVGVHTPPEAEIVTNCRDRVKGGQHFQLCRNMRRDGFIFYHVQVRNGEPETDLPTQQELLGAHRDQWGQAGFESPGVSGWAPAGTWRAELALVFADGENELTGTPTSLTPGQGGTVVVDWLFQRRTVTGKPEQYQVIQRVNDGQRFDYFPPFFRGTPPEVVFQFENPRTYPDPRTNEREETRILHVNGTDFLVNRVVHAGGRVNYWVARKTA